MKKEYITPKTTFVGIDEQPLMAGSEKFNNSLITTGTPANESQVTSKHHSLWDETWDDDDEDDNQ